jgi:predicted amidohydrolase YtcJ
VLIRGAEIEGRVRDARLEGARIAAVGERLARRPGEAVLDARGGALLPGLHDHHVHLHALAAALGSVDCGPPRVASAEALARALRAAAPAGGWIRGVGYHESVAGELRRERLDALRADVPVRIQHRSGACWMLNGAALARLGVGAAPLPDEVEAGVERDARGRPSGRLLRLDAWLRERLGPASFPSLDAVGRLLARRGVTGVTDATPGNGREALAAVEAALRRGALRCRVLLMGSSDLPEPSEPFAARGPVKLLLDERALPPLGELAEAVAAAHAAGRRAAVHCVTRSELLFALAAFDEAGALAGDRIEHASVTPPDVAARLARSGLAVVTQPAFVRERGDAYLRDVDADDRPWLYRAGGLLALGVPLGGGTDAPFGEPDPWAAMRAAVERTTREGRPLGRRESLAPERALALFTTRPHAPGGPPRRVAAGAPADLVLLDRPWLRARDALSRELVAAAWVGGAQVAGGEAEAFDPREGPGLDRPTVRSVP